MGVFQNNLLAGAAAAATAGGGGFYSHQIEQSVRFDRDGSSGLSRTFGTPTSQKKYTLSLWIKRTKTCEEIDGESNDWMHIMCRNNGFDGTGAAIAFNNGSYEDQVALYGFGVNAGNTTVTDAIYRDLNGFGHYVFRYDTTQSTAADRIRFYLNGTRQTVSGGTNPNQDSDNSRFNVADPHTIGGALGFFDGYMAEIIFADGQSYEPTQFGESKNGVWIPKDPSGTTFGNNGFHLKFENASDLGNDSSGNNNDFTASNMGADHQVLDSPTFGS